MILDKYSIGVGDRFAHQAKPQLAACVCAEKLGVTIIPVWNKSNREHKIIGSEPSQTRAAADEAVQELGWRHPYFCDADHINLDTVDRFLEPCDFFTIDVADSIGRPPAAGVAEAFLGRHPELQSRIEIPGIEDALEMSGEKALDAAGKYLGAVMEAGSIYREIERRRGVGRFVAESVDVADDHDASNDTGRDDPRHRRLHES